MADAQSTFPDKDWKPVYGHEAFYQVSSDGDVWSLLSSRLLSQSPTVKGYARVHIERPAPARTVKVHRLVLESFVCPRPDGAECRHINGDPSDNRLANLRWGTSTENKADQKVHGTMSWVKLTDAQVSAIRAKPPKRGCAAIAAATLKISTGHLYRILRGTRR